MALPSQSPRTITLSRAYSYRRKKRNHGPLIAAAAGLGVIALVGGGWMVLGGGDPAGAQEPAPANTEQQAAIADPMRTTGGNAARPQGPAIADRSPGVPRETARSVQQPRPEPAPVELHMGRGVVEQPDSAGAAPVEPTTAAAEPPPPTRPSVETPRSLPPAAGVAAQPSLPADLQALLASGRQALNAGDGVKGRELLNAALRDPRLPESERATLRGELSAINEDLVFSPRLVSGDPWTTTYAVQSGDSLVKIAQKQGVGADWRLIQRVNRISNPNAIRVGQKLKIVKGPFHAVVHKGAYRLDLFMGPAESPDSWVYVRSFTVGLGEGNSTPIGEFVVRRGSKLVNPHWVNPRTGEKFDANDPKNPIGERWIGLEGVGESAAYSGYGLHGTIDPDSIGKQKSMGCVRLSDADVELMYEVLTEGVSTVSIRP